MEYRRRSRRRRNTSSGYAGKVFVMLLVAGGIVYMVGASSAGEWVAQNVMAPVFRTVDRVISGTDEQDAPVPEVQPIVSTPVPTVSEAITKEVALESVECFALQMGAFSTEANASTEAEALRKQGAGGFIIEDAGMYRVLAAGYENETDLDAVREQLSLQGLDSTKYPLVTDAATLNVTATEADIEVVENGLNLLTSLQSEMARESLAFDHENKTAAEGKQLASAWLEQIDTAIINIEQLPQNGIIMNISDCIYDVKDAIYELYSFDTESFVDFSAKMKYTHLYTVDAYSAMIEKILNE